MNLSTRECLKLRELTSTLVRNINLLKSLSKLLILTSENLTPMSDKIETNLVKLQLCTPKANKMDKTSSSEQSTLLEERPTDPLLPSTKIPKMFKNLLSTKSLKSQLRKKSSMEKANAANKPPNLTFMPWARTLTSLKVTSLFR